CVRPGCLRSVYSLPVALAQGSLQAHQSRNRAHFMKRNKSLIYVDFFRSLRSRADGLLPLREGRAGRGGRRASALFLLLLGLGPAPLLQAAGDERQQIEQAIDGFLAERVAEEAERQGWQD